MNRPPCEHENLYLDRTVVYTNWRCPKCGRHFNLAGWINEFVAELVDTEMENQKNAGQSKS